ncbi:MAG: hypothetical protein JNK48_10215 [Bryobacterales bacterium]|nr:hypothetical protein [Bryobacterales bacterium]
MLLFLFAWSALAASNPVFETGVPAPTKDKPQSKLWYAKGTWWAWMPEPGGSRLWRRSPNRWTPRDDLHSLLTGLPSQADVWASTDDIAAVLVEKNRIAFVRARFVTGNYVSQAKPVVFPLDAPTETATLARDHAGRWWIAYNQLRRMWVRASTDSSGNHWQPPVEVSAEPAADDDICAITALPNGIGVIWSDQAQDKVLFRVYDSHWNPVETVDAGNKTADDHFNIALGRNGVLFVATKNSLDMMDQPQLVLRVRDHAGRWTNHPYATRTPEAEPSRPIAVIGGDTLFLLHSVYRRRPPPGFIALLSTATRAVRVGSAPTPLILPGPLPVNNVTGPKFPMPSDAPWIVLASDDHGRVYEAELPRP